VALILAIEPDARQAAIVRRVVRSRVHADLVLVETKDAALAEIERGIPDLILVTILLPPADEQDLVDRLRALDAEHLQTLTIPLLADGREREHVGRGVLSALRRKAKKTLRGCDPDVFAGEIGSYLEHAKEIREIEAERAAARAEGPAEVGRAEGAGGCAPHPKNKAPPVGTRPHGGGGGAPPNHG
jgi:CheY-like chemotaxis protein